MWRVINSLTKGVRSVRPSQCFQDCSDEGKKSESIPQNSLTLQCYSPSVPIATFRSLVKAVNYGDHGQIYPGAALERKSSCKICKSLFSGLKGKEQKWDGSDTDKQLQARYECVPQWHWEVLLDHKPHEIVCNKEETKKDGEEQKAQHWGRTCQWQQQHERIFLMHPFLQAMSWGSAVALTWSLFHYWGFRQSLHYWTTTQQLQQKTFRCRCQVISPYYNEADKKRIFWWGKNNSNQDLLNNYNIFARRYSTNNCCTSEYLDDHQGQCPSHTHIQDFQCEPYEKLPPNLHYFCNPEVNKSLFNSLWNIAGNQPQLRKSICPKVTDKIKPEDSLSSDIEIPGIHSCIQKIEGETDKQELEQSNKSKIEPCEGVDTHSFIKDKVSTQTDKLVSGNSDCSSNKNHNLEVQDWLQASDTVQELRKSNHEDELKVLTRESEIRTDWVPDCTVVDEETTRHEELYSDPHMREKVEIEDCNCDVTDQSRGIGASSDHQDTKTGIEEFSDSLMQILNAGSEDIKSIQDQVSGGLDGDIGRSLVDKEPHSAVIYFRAGALLGDTSSTFNLALCYHLGRGVNQNLKKARELYEVAALAGHSWATYNLAVLLSQGQGGPTDLDRAYSLLVQAGSKGVQEAQEALKQMEKQDEEKSMKGVLRSSQSEPVITSVPSRRWSSSHSLSELDFTEESDEWLSIDFSNNSLCSSNTELSFYLG